jgi:hypothetical protein
MAVGILAPLEVLIGKEAFTELAKEYGYMDDIARNYLVCRGVLKNGLYSTVKVPALAAKISAGISVFGFGVFYYETYKCATDCSHLLP